MSQGALDAAVTITSNKVGRAAKWAITGEIIAKIASPLTNMVLARIIDHEIFGIIATINMVTSLSEIFTEAGFQLYIIQHEFKSEKEMHDYASTALWISLIIGLAMFGMISFFRNSIAAYVGSPGYGNEIMVAGISIPLVSIISIQQCIYRRNLNYKPLFLRRILGLVVPFAVTIPLALLGWEGWALIAGTLTERIVNVIVLLVNSEWKPRLYVNFHYIAQMAPFCMTTLISYVASWATNWIDIFITSNTLGSYYTGLYKNSQATVNGILAIITASMTPIVFSVLCRYQNDHDKFRETMESFTEKLSMLLLPIGFGSLVFRRLITYIMLGPKWMETSDLIGILALCSVLSNVYAAYCREACRAKGKPHLNIIAQLMSLCLIIPASYFGAKAGFATLTYARPAASLTLIVFYYIIIYFKLGISPLRLVRATIIPMGCSVVMAVCVYLLKLLSTGVMTDFLIILAGVVIYGSLIYLFPRSRKILIEVLDNLTIKSLKPFIGKLNNHLHNRRSLWWDRSN